MSMYKYEQIAELVKSCQACPLAFRGVGVPGEYVHHKERNAFGVLDPSRVMVILEAPGGTEQDIGRPVVGDSGKLFRTLMDECGVHSYYVTNVAKHRPLVKKGKQQPPDAVTVTACSGFLDAEITMIQPEKIILCGNVAASRILGVPGNTAQKDLVKRTYNVLFTVAIEPLDFCRRPLTACSQEWMEQTTFPTTAPPTNAWRPDGRQSTDFQRYNGLALLDDEVWQAGLQYHMDIGSFACAPDVTELVVGFRAAPLCPDITTPTTDALSSHQCLLVGRYDSQGGRLEGSSHMTPGAVDGTFAVYHACQPSNRRCQIPHGTIILRSVSTLQLYHPAYFLHNRTAAFVNKEVNDWKRALRNFMGAEIPHYPIEEVKCNAHS